MITDKESQFQTIIHKRQSTRVLFDMNHSIAKEDLKKILDAGRWAPTAHNMQNFEVIVVDDKKKLEMISNIESPVSEVFIRENFEHLSFSKEELMKKKVGILGTMFPPEWRDPDKIAHPPANLKRVRMNQGDFIKTSPVLMVVTYDPSERAPASEGDFLGIMSLGCVLENMWLMTESLGLALHIVSSLSNPNTEEQVKKILNIPATLKIGISFRLGYPMSTQSDYLRVRRDIEDFAYTNSYGKKFT